MQTESSALAPTRNRQKISLPSKATKWTQYEDDVLIHLLRENPKASWNELSPHFPGKTSQQVAERWSKVVNPNLVKGSWTRQEDEVIISFVQQYGCSNWTKLASMLPGRIGKQCRERWRNHLDPSNKNEPWTQEEDALLMRYHEQFGNSWVKIATMMPGRSDNSIKNRWNSTLKKQSPSQTVIQCKYSTPVTDFQQLVELPQTPSTGEQIPKPVIDDADTYEQQSSGPSTRLYDIISPFAVRSPFGSVSPFSRSDSLLSPWNVSGGVPVDNLFSPTFSPRITRSQNREPNLNLLLDKGNDHESNY